MTSLPTTDLSPCERLYLLTAAVRLDTRAERYVNDQIDARLPIDADAIRAMSTTNEWIAFTGDLWWLSGDSTITRALAPRLKAERP